MFREKGIKQPTSLSTGTTICGVKYKDGVVLGSDTRATAGPIVQDKNCQKIHYLAPNLYYCGAGTAADTEAVADMVSSKLKLHRYETGKESRVDTALTHIKQHLFYYQGYVSAALVLGGVDCKGSHLHFISPHGNSEPVPFTAMGSGSLAAMAVLETRWKQNMTEEEAKLLVHDAICAGIFNDEGSGSFVDLAIISKKDGATKAQYCRGYDTSNDRKYRKEYHVPLGTTTVLKQKVKLLKEMIIVEEKQKVIPEEKEAMDIALD